MILPHSPYHTIHSKRTSLNFIHLHMHSKRVQSLSRFKSTSRHATLTFPKIMPQEPETPVQLPARPQDEVLAKRFRAIGYNEKIATLNKKANNKRQTKEKVEPLQISHEEEVKLKAYFMYSQASLLSITGKRESFIRFFNDLDPLEKDKKVTLDDLLQRCRKAARLKGKYKYRDKFNYLNDELLKGLKFKPVPRKQTKKRRDTSSSDEEESQSQLKKGKVQKSQARSMSSWKRVNGCDPKTKVFIIKGGYQPLRQMLLKRGWFQNLNHGSYFFDLKFTCMINDIVYDCLESKQIVNHFNNTQCLTSKFGLSRSLRSLVYNFQVDIDRFYPRCYDLADILDFESFLINYQQTFALSTLRQLLNNPSQSISKRKASLCMKVLRNSLYKFSDTIKHLHKGQPFKALPAQEWLEVFEEEVEEGVSLCEKDRKEIGTLVAEAEKLDPQASLNGHRNIWILKPNYLSRGRGIRCMSDLWDILSHCSGKDIQFVVQKYIENPMLINHRKFDIRVWVIVQDYQPTKIFLFEEMYLRFCCETYNPEALGNRFSHLTNNSISKHSSKFNSTESMWSQEQFIDYLNKERGEGVWERLYKRIKEIIIWSVLSCQDQVSARKNTFEMFGYDFMVDDAANPWLIQVNSSPSMDQSTPITNRLVDMLLEDTVRIIERKKKTGHLKLIYRGDAPHTPQFYKLKY